MVENGFPNLTKVHEALTGNGKMELPDGNLINREFYQAAERLRSTLEGQKKANIWPVGETRGVSYTPDKKLGIRTDEREISVIINPQTRSYACVRICDPDYIDHRLVIIYGINSQTPSAFVATRGETLPKPVAGLLDRQQTPQQSAVIQEVLEVLLAYKV